MLGKLARAISSKRGIGAGARQAPATAFALAALTASGGGVLAASGSASGAGFGGRFELLLGGEDVPERLGRLTELDVVQEFAAHDLLLSLAFHSRFVAVRLQL